MRDGDDRNRHERTCSILGAGRSEQTTKATRFIRNDSSSEHPKFINRLALREMVWVLETVYGYARTNVTLALEKILRTKQFELEDHPEAWPSFREYQEGADFRLYLHRRC